MSTKKLTTSRRKLLKGTAATAAIAPFFIGKPARAAGEPEFTFKFATVAPRGTPWQKQADGLRKYVDKVSEGRVKFKMFYGGGAGGELETAEATAAGRMHGWAGSTGGLANLVPEMEAFELPYLFKSSKTAQKALAANRTMIHDILWERGFKLLSFAENGYRSLGTTFPVEKPSDLKGRKIRTQETKSHVDLFKSLGATPSPMGITEVLSALQTGVVEGYDNTQLFAFAAALYMATTHWTDTRHIYQPGAIVLSRKGAWDKMPAELQEALTGDEEQMHKMEDRGFRMVRALEPQITKNFGDLGIEFHEPDIAAFKKLAEPVHDHFKKRATKQGKALLDALKKAT